MAGKLEREIKRNINVQALVEFPVDRARVNQLVRLYREWLRLDPAAKRREGKGPLIKPRGPRCNRAQYF